MEHCASFNALTSGTNYQNGDTVPSLIEYLVSDFVWANGTTTTMGKLKIDNRGYAQGTGNDLNLNNATMVPQHNFPVGIISLKFAWLGGNNNITINGQFSQVTNPIDLNGTTINGVSISVTAVQNGNNWYGVMLLSGDITSFSIGGQELWVDDYCFDTLPFS